MAIFLQSRNGPRASVYALWCREVDLRPMPSDELIRAYRSMAQYFGYVDEQTNGQAWIQLERLACIVKRGDASVQRAFVALLEEGDIAIRYCAAVQSIQHRFATRQGLRVLETIGKGRTPFAISARIRLLDWHAGIAVEL